jgi:hypothetical protein
MRIMGKVAAAVAIGVAGLLGVAPTVSAAPAPINHGDSTGSEATTAGHPWHG